MRPYTYDTQPTKIIPTLTAVLVLLSLAAGATTYYVDSAGGNDANTGRAETVAWRNLSKLNAINFQPGDTILLKRGSFWREQLNITRSGTASAPITYAAYGTGGAPVLCGSERVSGWAVHNAAANIWRAPYQWVSPTGPSFAAPDFVLINGIPSPQKTSIANCTSERDWCYSSGILYINLSTTPTNVEIGKRNYGIFTPDNANIQHIVVDGIEIKSANYKSIMIGQGNHNWTLRNLSVHHNGAPEAPDRSGIDIRGCDNMLISGCTIYQTGKNGIQVSGGSNNIVEYCDVHDIRNNGISMRGSSSRTCQGNIIRYNTVYQSPSPWTGINGIVVTDDAVYPISNTKIYGNVISNISNIGVLLYGTTNNNVELYNNTVYNAHRCYVLCKMGNGTVTVKNNIGMTIWSDWHPIFSLETTNLTNKTVDYNLWYKPTADTTTVQNGFTPYSSLASWRSATGFDAHSIFADPLFTSVSTRDFRLQATSPAVNSGISVGMTVDMTGLAIPQGPLPDLGAYERPVQGVNTPPTITLTGSSPVNVAVGASYSDAGATAYDAQDGNLTPVLSKSGTVDTSCVGTYYITYSVTDTAGSTATATRTVRVVDSTKPVIALLGDATIPLAVGWTYTEPGATATDNYDGNLTSVIVATGSVNTAIPGTYTVTYNVSDSSGNAATPVTRTVVVTVDVPPDTKPPVLTLVGDASVTIPASSTYVDPGAVAIDNYDGDISDRIVVTGMVKISVAGNYYLTYNVSDSAGNAARSVTRRVIVTQTSAPAATYYVDALAGNDANNGTSVSTPWKSMAKVNSRAFAAGSTILLKRGCVWRDQLNVTKSGTATAPITYGAYGTGAAPVLNGSDLLTGWTIHDSAKKIWKAPYKWESPIEPSFSTVDLAFFNGEVGVKKTSVPALTAEGEWYYVNGYMYVYANAMPTNFEVAKRNYGVYCSDKWAAKYIVLQDIEIRNANYKSILVGSDNHNWTIKNIVAHRNGRREDVEDGGKANDRHGIVVRNCDNTLITGCTVFLAGSNGIQVTGGSNNIIEKCTVYDAQHHCIDMKGSSSRTCRNNIIRYNTVYQRPTTPNPQNGIVLTDDGSQPISDTKVYGNVVYGIHDIGLLIYGYTNNNVQVFNNTCYNCHKDYALINMGTNTVVVKNNIGMTTYNNWHPVFSLENTSISNKSIDYNLWIKKGTDGSVVQNGYTTYKDLVTWKNVTGFDAHSILADPLFVNVSAFDFRLQATSPGIDKGTPMGITVDKAGTPIPDGAAPDMGAYERMSQAVNTPPEITLLELASLSVPVGEPFIDPGATAYDTEDGDISQDIIVTGTVDVTVLDTYTLAYNVADSAGATAPAVFRSVHVIDTRQPSITLIGPSVQNVLIGSVYTDPGATAIDNYEGDISANIVATGDVDTQNTGVYTIAYNVADTSGNPAQEVVRTINILPSDTNRPVITLLGRETMTVPFGSEYVDEGATASDDRDGDITSAISVSGVVSTSIIGTYILTYTVADAAGNQALPVMRTVTVTDTVAPRITLNGEAFLTVEVYSTYLDPGAAALDNYDGSISDRIAVSGLVDATRPGAYTLTYTVADSSGNAAQPVTRTVEVIDTTRPTVNLVGDAIVTVPVGSVFVDPGATAADNYDLNLTPAIVVTGSINTAVLGAATFTYTVTDSSGNQSAPVTRTVEVVDTINPAISLVGNAFMTLEVGSSFTDPGATASDNYDFNLTPSIVKTGTVRTDALGVYAITYTVADSSGNAAQPAVRTVEVIDTATPVITLVGEPFILLEVGSSYTDAGATASDNYDAGLTRRIICNGTVDTSKLGAYSLTYTVADSSGNPAQPVVRTIEVIDTTKPVVAMTGNSMVTVEVNSVYADPGATATDNYDTSMSIQTTGAVDTAVPGAYTLTYTATDSSGNMAIPVTRTVNVVDSTPPALTLVGSAATDIAVNSVYSDAGATATDNYDQTVSGRVQTTGAVNTAVLGTYTLTYTVADAAGNSASPITRTVRVVDTVAPVISLNGETNMTIAVGSTFSDPGATVTDNYDFNLAPATEKSGSVNANRLGTYTLTYSVVDSSGNPAVPVTRTVHVVDTVKPVLTLLGNGSISTMQNTAFTDPGASAIDNYDGDITSVIGVAGSVNVSVPGTYTLTYNVADSSGNSAASVTRTVTVVRPLDTFYVDSALGADTNDGRTADKPWRTVAKVNGTALTPGTTVLFKRGGFWRDQLNVTKSGTAAAPITYGAYGTGAAPVFCGSDRVTGWTLHDAAKNIWKAPYTWESPALPYFATVDLVFFNGEVGVKRTSMEGLVAERNWFHTSNTLYVYAAAAPTSVEVGKRNYGVYAADKTGAQYIVIQDLEIKNANYKSIMVGSDNHNWTIKNVVAHRNGRREDIEDGGRSNDRSAIAVRGCDNALISGCTIYLAGSSGVQITGGSNNTVEKCTIYDTQNSGVYLKASSLRPCQNNIIRYNTIYLRPQTLNGMNGIVVSDDGTNAVRDTRIYGNIINNISENGILLYGPNNQNAGIYNNTAYNCHRCYVLTNVQSAATILNNIGATNKDGWHPVFSLDNTPIQNKIVDYNVWTKSGADTSVVQNGFAIYKDLVTWRATTGFDTHSLLADPLFVNVTASDFRLQPASPAVDAATDVGLIADISNTPVPQGAAADIGACEKK